MQKYFSDYEVAKRYGVSRQTVWRWAKLGILPAPVQLSPGCTRWDGSRLDKLDAGRQQQAEAAA